MEGKSQGVLQEIQMNFGDDTPEKQEFKVNFLETEMLGTNGKLSLGPSAYETAKDFLDKEDHENTVKFLKFQGCEDEDDESPKEETKEDELSDRRDSISDASNDDINDSQPFNELDQIGTIQFLKKNYDYYIERVYNNVKVEEFKGKGVTKGSEFEKLTKLDPEKSKVLEDAALEFVVCPQKAKDILLENKITDHSPDHFAKFLYCMPIDLTAKTKFMFLNTDDFALKAKGKFVECFSFFDMRIKEFLLTILTKCCPPSDFEKRQAFYQFF